MSEPVRAGMSMLVGLGCVAVAIFNQEFYWLKGFYSQDKLAPRWSGRLFFGAVGILFFLAGAYTLFR